MKEGGTTVRGKGEGRNKKVRSCAATLEHNVSFAQLIFLSTTTFIMYIFFYSGYFQAHDLCWYYCKRYARWN